MTAIITCGETRQSLSAVRALGRVHIPIDEDIYPHKFAEQIADELRARYATCALVSSDNALWALSRFRELLPIAARKILPPHYSVVHSLDHGALHHFAESLNIPCAELVRVPEGRPKAKF